MGKSTNTGDKLLTAIGTGIVCALILGVLTAIAGNPTPGIVIGLIGGFIFSWIYD